MLATVRENLGDSRYIVGLALQSGPLTEEIERFQTLIDDTREKIAEATQTLAETREPYNEVMAELYAAIDNYSTCTGAFDEGACIAAAFADCDDTRDGCISECESTTSADAANCASNCDDERTSAINSAIANAESICSGLHEPGTPEFDQCVSDESSAAIADADSAHSQCIAQCESRESEALAECSDRCDDDRDECRTLAEDSCAKAKQAAANECETTWWPIIAEIQARGVELLGPIQEALLQLHTEEALLLQYSTRLNELSTVDGLERQITCFTAQYNDELEIGAEVMLAITPAGRNVITDHQAAWSDIDITDRDCLFDSRVFDGNTTFVNAAIATGAETWAPSWRTGVVKVVNADDTLNVEVDPATLYGTLGTRISQRDIDCTPPQAYFDGEDSTQRVAEIEAARAALVAAQEARVAAEAARVECIDSWGDEWRAECYAAAVSECDAEWTQLQVDCLNAGGSVEYCQSLYDDGMVTCTALGESDCIDEQAAGIAACEDEHMPNVLAAREAVAAAQAQLARVLSNLYNPASPLTLDLPVAHCSVDRYEVGDEVLIDFPERDYTAGAMAVWDSARVIGWASETRECIEAPFFIVMYSYRGTVPEDDIASLNDTLQQIAAAESDARVLLVAFNTHRQVDITEYDFSGFELISHDYVFGYVPGYSLYKNYLGTKTKKVHIIWEDDDILHWTGPCTFTMPAPFSMDNFRAWDANYRADINSLDTARTPVGHELEGELVWKPEEHDGLIASVWADTYGVNYWEFFGPLLDAFGRDWVMDATGTWCYGQQGSAYYGAWQLTEAPFTTSYNQIGPSLEALRGYLDADDDVEEYLETTFTSRGGWAQAILDAMPIE